MAKIKKTKVVKVKKSKPVEAKKEDDNVVIIPPVRMSDDPTPRAVSVSEKDVSDCVVCQYSAHFLIILDKMD